MFADVLSNVIYGNPYKINDELTINNPTIEDICFFGEKRYWQLVSTIVSRPYDAMVKLDDMGINYQKIPDYDFFIMQAIHLEADETKILFGDFSFKGLQLMPSEDGSDILLVKNNGKVVFDKISYTMMVQYVRYIHFIKEKIEYDVGNEMTRKHLIEDTRRKMEREKRKNKNKQFESILSDIVSSIVNANGCVTTYEDTKKMHISQIYDSYMRICKILNYQQTMTGVYAGTVSYKDLDKSIIDWSGKIH